MSLTSTDALATTDVSPAEGAAILPSQRWRAVRAILTFVAPGALLFVLVMTAPSDALPGLLGVPPALVCLVMLWAALSHEPLPSALVRGLAQVTCFYFAALGTELLRGQPPLKQTPGAPAIATACFAVPPLVAALLLRAFRWRLTGQPTVATTLALPRFQFRLADVFGWLTLAAVFLAAGTALISKFNQEDASWAGLGLAIMVFCSAILCVPTGLLSLVFAWLILCRQHAWARLTVALMIASSWLTFALLAWGQGLRRHGWDDIIVLFLVTLAIAVPVLLTFGLARLTGWQLVRLPRK